MEWAQQTSSEMIGFLERMGVNVALFHAMAAVPSESMEFIDHDRLRQWNLIAEAPPSGPDASDGTVAFTELDGFDAVGHDLVGMPLREVTLEQCKSRCSSSSECKALTYNKRATACFLKNSASVIFRDGTAFAAYDKQLEKRVRVSDLVSHGGRELVGESYRRESGLGYADCMLLCDGDAKCVGFNFDHGKRACTLLDHTGEQRANPLMSSGEKFVAN
jgi:hypothetical protein